MQTAPFAPTSSRSWRGPSIVGLVLLLVATPARANDARPHWIGAWGASPSATARADARTQDYTVRQVVHLGAAGTALRLRLSNALTGTPTSVDSVRIARPGARPGTIVASSEAAVTFGGAGAITIPAHASVLSDPVPIAVASGDDLTVSFFVAQASADLTVHDLAAATGFVAPNDQSGSLILSDAKPIAMRIVLAGIDVETRSAGGTLVALGDSITDGAASTPGANRRWPDRLAARLRAARGLSGIGVVNAGIAGNRLLRDSYGPNALSRLPRDVLALPDLRFVCVLEGINDIIAGDMRNDSAGRVTADDLIAGYRQIIAQGHEHDAKVLIGTLTPFAGHGLPEAVRQAVNRWIRTKDGFDGVLDFDAAIRDPHDPDRMLPAYDSGDHLHPSDAGYAAMAASIDLGLLR